MKTNLERFFSSFVTTIVLLLIYAFGLAVATFIEKYHGTATAKAMVYYSPLFFLLQFLLVVNFIAATIKHQYLKRGKWGLMLTHFAFIIILLGALTSFLFGEEGILHLREGETSNQIAVRTSDNTTFHTLPFSVELKKFTLTRYPGSASPSSYESEVIVHVDGEDREERIFMNNVLDVKGYRFFQASYDQDEHGTILSVNRDVAGRNITYTGYLLLVIGLILCLVGKDSRFMRQSRRLKELRKATNVRVLLLALLAVPLSVNAGGKASPMLDAVQKYAVSPEHAALFGALPIQSGSGRMMPVNTFSSEILRKLHKSDKIGQLNSDQFLLSLLAMPDMWMRVPFIALSNPELAAYYDLTDGECAYIQAFDSNGSYKIIAENGQILAESKRFGHGILYSEIDVERLCAQRRRMTTFVTEDQTHTEILFSLKIEETKLTRFIDPAPFVPTDRQNREKRCDEILMIQAMGLKKRLEHTGANAVVGISGGLDSTLALLVTVRAFDLCGRDHKGITAVTMPGFGTTDRTYDNAVKLIQSLGAEFVEVDICQAVNVHFSDIGQDPSVHDVTYENSQARERTQILMDIANKKNALVIGTGDLSELALAFNSPSQ